MSALVIAIAPTAVVAVFLYQYQSGHMLPWMSAFAIAVARVAPLFVPILIGLWSKSVRKWVKDQWHAANHRFATLLGLGLPTVIAILILLPQIVRSSSFGQVSAPGEIRLLPIMSDSLDHQTREQGMNWWDTYVQPEGGGCAFINHAYQAIAQRGDITFCLLQNTSVGNVALQVRLVIIQGGEAGIVFGTNPEVVDSPAYYFGISQEGVASLFVRTGAGHESVLHSEDSPAIHQGYGQFNVLKVVASGNSVSLYINDQRVWDSTNTIKSAGRADARETLFLLGSQTQTNNPPNPAPLP